MNKLINKAYSEAKLAQKNAYAPYSKFNVGAALVDQNENIWRGCNVENGSYGATICAERVAIFNSIAHGGTTQFKFILLVTDPKAVPCALCLQVLSEFCRPDFKIILATPQEIYQEVTLGELLPTPFNADLLSSK